MRTTYPDVLRRGVLILLVILSFCGGKLFWKAYIQAVKLFVPVYACFAELFRILKHIVEKCKKFRRYNAKKT